jgi:hypothetical protein
MRGVGEIVVLHWEGSVSLLKFWEISGVIPCVGNEQCAWYSMFHVKHGLMGVDEGVDGGLRSRLGVDCGCVTTPL